MKRSKKTIAPSGYFVKAVLIFFILAFSIFEKVFSQGPACTPPTASISLVTSSICKGNPASLRLTSATGQGPYDVIVNGLIYSNLNLGQPFGPLSTSDISIWSNSDIPVNPDAFDAQALEVGTKFRSSVNGYITGMRFYKGITNLGVHIGSLWSNTGTLLARAEFSAETASGWQEIRFTTPVAILSNTTYTVSYYSQNGVYAYSPGYFASNGATNGPLTALQTGVDGPNGVYKYGAGFPTLSFASNNYSVDVLFTESLMATTTNYLLTSITDANGCNNTGNLSTATLTINPLPTGILSAVQSVCTGEEISLNFNAGSGTGPFSIVTNSMTHANVNNNQPFSSGINAAPPSPIPVSIWPSGVSGVESIIPDNSPVELGVKFKSSITGSITGIRFYKRVENTGTHTGSLWTKSGTLLGTATFTGETASGWQQVNFPIPIAITANQTFIASYFAPNGHYSFINNYFNGYSATNSPLTAFQSNATDGSNGVFKYGGGFPTGSFNDANYWVDVVFTGSQGNNVINMTQITDANGCTTSASPIQTISVASKECIPLAVTLVDFHLGVQSKKIVLEWKTATENNNSGFEIQRSMNGNIWNMVGFVKGAGNSSSDNHYSFTDADLSNGRYYYRLKQIDFEGKFKFSQVLSGEIKGGPQFYLGQNYPNPASGTTVINFSLQQQSPVNILLYDVYGRLLKTLVNEIKSAGQYMINADLHSLSPGTYYYRMNSGAFNDTKKLVVANR
jgi:Domain of unknown function (DUF4082)/Secretion system C-terminal sorting domain